MVGAGVHVNISYPASWSEAPHAIHIYRKAEKRYKTVTIENNSHKNSYKSYIIQLSSTVETDDRLR